MNKLTIKALVKRRKPSKDLWRIKLIDSSRCIFEYKHEKLSVLVYDIQDGEIKVGEQKYCEITFLTGDEISDIIAAGEDFKLTLVNEIIADGKVVEILSRGIYG